jgi:hypothetical protein
MDNVVVCKLFVPSGILAAEMLNEYSFRKTIDAFSDHISFEEVKSISIKWPNLFLKKTLPLPVNN